MVIDFKVRPIDNKFQDSFLTELYDFFTYYNMPLIILHMKIR